jgi:hypothetical protein
LGSLQATSALIPFGAGANGCIHKNVMSNSAREDKLKKLYQERDAKFDEIVSCLGKELYRETSGLTKADWKQLNDDAEELTNNWATAEYERRLPVPSTKLQGLLNEHQELCKRIINILDAEEPEG